jgi:4-oxalocrotonate tautomerase family enzyme
MPYVKIEVTREGVSREQKQALVQGVTTLLQQVLNKNPATTFVTIDEIDTDNWGAGGELVSDLRRRQAAAAAAPVAAATAPLQAPPAPSPFSASAGDVPALLALASDYLDALYFADAERLARVFHPRARYFSTAEGRLKELDMPAYFEIVRGRVSGAKTGQPRYDRLLSVDVAGPHTALVKLECALPPRHFTDYLSLVKEEGRWSIISKVFEVRALPQ